jgi:FAD/FMN-containing dehydrogenase
LILVQYVADSVGTVKPAGGFGQTAGHAPLSSSYGLGADNILEFKVVTAGGKYIAVNANTNKQLFDAMRGGGGGTFGIVIEATFKAHKTPKIIVRPTVHHRLLNVI